MKVLPIADYRRTNGIGFALRKAFFIAPRQSTILAHSEKQLALPKPTVTPDSVKLILLGTDSRLRGYTSTQRKIQIFRPLGQCTRRKQDGGYEI